jgi:lipopolysaccharide heptosyltransferase II
VRKVLIAQPFGIGDALFMTPLLRVLKEEGGAERIDLLLGSRTREAFETNPHVDDIFVIDRDRLRSAGAWAALREIAGRVREIAARRYDLFIDCSLSREYAFFAKFFARIPDRIGFDHKRRGLFLTRSVRLPAGYTGKHVLRYFTDLAALAGVRIRDEKPEFFLTREDEEKARHRLEAARIACGTRFLALAPGGGESWGKDAHFKRWPPAHFAAAADGLAGDLRFSHVVILGSARERSLGDEVLSSLKTPAVNLSGELSLRECAAVLARSLFLLCNDGGLVHIARALEVPLVALYGPVDEKIYGPHPPSSRYLAVGREGLDCRPCYQNFRYNAACPHRECLTRFEPLEILQKIRESGFLDLFASAPRAARS